MAAPKCQTCALRGRYDKHPKSLLGRLWRWHANWCPGWRAYMRSLPPEEREAIAEKYKMKKFRGNTAHD
ncbi:MAG: hypothetical protein P8010_24930 [Desulfosarcinaceae bacterium]|jgi:hypothetical protein